MSHDGDWDRRAFLRVGGLALGGFWTAAAQAGRTNRPRARACILLYMDGGPSHIDLWDLKPDAPAEVRGPFQPITTSVPGVQVCEHLPRVARQMHRLAQVRSVVHGETVHDPAVYQMLTGRKHPSSSGDLQVQPTDFPQVGTAFGVLDARPAVMPKVVETPETMRMNGRILPGQNAGFLGASHDPLRVEVTPEGETAPSEFAPRADVSPDRLKGRLSLLDRLDRTAAALETRAETTDLGRFQHQALALLSRPEVRQAFDLRREPVSIRDRYGRSRHGQSVLLARRLVEVGARFVTVYWGHEMQDWADGRGLRPANNPWDTHRNQFPLLKEQLLPRADQALAALVDDLQERGLLGETLIVWMGDFGRTPRIVRKYASRDHWPHANTVLFAGAGVPGGAVYGRTDGHAAHVAEDPVSPADLTATILRALGVDPRAIVADGEGRPFVVFEGEPITALLP